MATSFLPPPASRPPSPPTFSGGDSAIFRTGGYQPQFDGLRALAVLTVVVDHFGADIPNFPLPDFIHLGPIGVRLFLVLSGYFITGSLARTRNRLDAGRLGVGAALGEFYRRRFLRIGPPYAVFVLAAMALGLGVVRERLIWVLTFSVNFLIAWSNQWPLAMSHLWSICVQEQFYLFWPALLFLLPRRWMMRAIVGCALAGVAFRAGCVLTGAPLLVRWVLPPGSLDALAAGAALAWGGRRLEAALRPHTLWGRAGAGVACLLMLTGAAVLRDGDPNRLASIWVEPLEALALTWLVAFTAPGFTGWRGRFLRLPPLVYAGRVSYGIYLYHIPVAICMDQWLPRPWHWLVDVPTLRIIVLSLVTLACAALSWEWIERPIDRWRRKPALAGLIRSQGVSGASGTSPGVRATMGQ